MQFSGGHSPTPYTVFIAALSRVAATGEGVGREGDVGGEGFASGTGGGDGEGDREEDVGGEGLAGNRDGGGDGPIWATYTSTCARVKYRAGAPTCLIVTKRARRLPPHEITYGRALTCAS